MLFMDKARQTDTLAAVASMAVDRSKWTGAHDLFNRIRHKTLAAHKRNDSAAVAQYEFEEICTKCIHNLGMFPAPFDSDSQYWVIPRAIHLARQLGIPESEVVQTITTQSGSRGGFSPSPHTTPGGGIVDDHAGPH